MVWRSGGKWKLLPELLERNYLINEAHDQEAHP